MLHLHLGAAAMTQQYLGVQLHVTEWSNTLSGLGKSHSCTAAQLTTTTALETNIQEHPHSGDSADRQMCNVVISFDGHVKYSVASEFYILRCAVKTL